MTAVRTGILEALRDEYEAGTRLVLGRPCWSELGTDDLRGAKVDPVVLGIWLEASHSEHSIASPLLILIAVHFRRGW